LLFSQTDDELMEKIAKGHSASFRSLFDRHSPRLLGYCSRFMGEKIKAEDVVQEVWMKVVRSAPSYRSEKKFISWLLMIARTTCLSELRKKSAFESIDLFENINDGDDTPLADEQMATAQDLVLLKKSIDELPDAQRVVLTFWMVHESSYEEIAQETTLTVASVKSLLFRARQTLEKKLKGGTHEMG